MQIPGVRARHGVPVKRRATAARGRPSRTVFAFAVLAAATVAAFPSAAAFAGSTGSSSGSSASCLYDAGCQCIGSVHLGDFYVNGRYDGGCPCIPSGGFSGLTPHKLCPPTYAPRPIEARLTGNVNTGPANASFRIMIFGSGFDPKEVVVLTLDGSVPLGTATTDSNGNFQITLTIDAGLHPGTHEIVATGKTSGSVATFQITILGPPPPPPKGYAPHFTTVQPPFSESNEGSGPETKPDGGTESTKRGVLLLSGTAIPAQASTSVEKTVGIGASSAILAVVGLLLLAMRRRRSTANQG